VGFSLFTHKKTHNAIMMMGTRIEDDIETYIQTSYLIVKQEKE